ncbi:hypothetical protein KFK09_011303 [Dendrobium nobile]|uniref:ZF-HD dimerization-type domain-containing protein n=1 Tax=Dendrobium nobile TaxID=94219 RepID=A0A8T3BE60_DENNO|nr:hypothetical protein KFK09_011303 [Dendrobium nobile]
MDYSDQEEEDVQVVCSRSMINQTSLNGASLFSFAGKKENLQPRSHHSCKRVAAASTKYRECLKNHAASFGGNATDGCGEFMPGGADGMLEALKCSACGCHRNFHRKEVEGEPFSSSSNSMDHCLHFHSYIMPRPVAMVPPMLPPSEMPEDKKKRLRTRFTAEQKEKMARFAEKVGWKLQRHEEDVGNFCEEIGIKRRVLKVWMHNNKHNFAQKNNTVTTKFD